MADEEIGAGLAETSTISGAPPSDPGQDYAGLRAEGLRLLQEMAGTLWSDYNAHDPGVTILEQLCYALTELSYRANFPLADLLADRDGRIGASRQALFSALQAFPCAPLTVDDYRRLLADRVPGLANLWLNPQKERGCYDLYLYAPGHEKSPEGEPLHPDMLKKRARRVYCRHRNLCEDLDAIVVLKPMPVVVSGEISIDAQSQPETVLAELFFTLDQALAPRLRRQSLEELAKAGWSPAAIFDGPLLKHGFIAAQELRPKTTKILLSELRLLLAGVPGVVTLGATELREGSWQEPGEQSKEELTIPGDKIPAIDIQANGQGWFSLTLLREGVKCRPNLDAVRRAYDALLAKADRRFPLKRSYRKLFPIPRGDPRDLGRYSSIQEQFPTTYGTTSSGLPVEASPQRRAQAQQLKAYLLFFEQLLANFFAQLEGARDLFSTDAKLDRSYFFQSLADSVPNVASLLAKNYEDGLRSLVADQDRFDQRRNRFLDLLLALYAEAVPAAAKPFSDRGGGQESERLSAQTKLALLRQLPRVTRRRGQGFDYLAPLSRHNVSGLELKTRLLLGPDQDLNELGLILTEEEQEIGHEIARDGLYGPDIDNLLPEPSTALSKEVLKEAADFLPNKRISKRLLFALSNSNNIRIGKLSDRDEKWALIVYLSDDRSWHIIDRNQPSRELAARLGQSFVYISRHLVTDLQHFYIFELNFFLLRQADSRVRERDDFWGVKIMAPLLNPFTIVLVARDGDRVYRDSFREVIQANLPAHLSLVLIFVSHNTLWEIHQMYDLFQMTLGDQDGGVSSLEFKLTDLARILRQYSEQWKL
ncbi:MAG TPA: hypothetical protein VHL08_00680 [Dongiaceae bacterium]|jgi:hypothetical protein|nr:hypothetical protein [Dongiaceae bacterium]